MLNAISIFSQIFSKEQVRFLTFAFISLWYQLLSSPKNLLLWWKFMVIEMNQFEIGSGAFGRKHGSDYFSIFVRIHKNSKLPPDVTVRATPILGRESDFPEIEFGSGKLPESSDRHLVDLGSLPLNNHSRCHR